MKLSNVILAALFIPGMAMAENTEAPAAAAEAKITTGGYLQTNLYLLNSEKANPMYFSHEAWGGEFYLNYEEGIVSANSAVRYEGNSVDPAGAQKQGGVIVRKAAVSITPHEIVTFSLGRIRPDGAAAWGVDATAIPDGYGAVDGLQLGANIPLGIAKINAGVTWGANEGLGGKSNTQFAWTAPASASKGLILNLGAKALEDKVSVNFYYGMQQDMITSLNNGAPNKLNTVSQIELSAGYDMEGLGAGFWMQMNSADNTRGAKVEDGLVKVDTAAPVGTDKANTRLIGFGANGDTTLFGLKDVLKKDGKIIYGASFGMYSVAEDAKKAVNHLAVGAGYAIGKYKAELNYAMKLASEKVFADAKETAAQSKSASTAYLTVFADF